MPLFDDLQIPRPGEIHKPQQPRTDRSRSLPSAIEAAPLKKPVEAEKPAFAPYNPYPPRAQTLKSSTPWGLITLMAVLFFGGLFLISTFVAQKVAERAITRALHKAVAPFEETAAISFANLNVSLFKRSLQINHVEVALAATDTRPAATIVIDRARVWGLDWASLSQMASTRKPVLPETMKVALDGIHLPLEAFGPQAQMMLQGMGYTHLYLSTYVDVAMSKRLHSLDLRHFQLRAPHMGQIDANLSLRDFALPTLAQISRAKADPKSILADAVNSKIALRGLDFTFQDDTFTQRFSNVLQRMGEDSPLSLAQLALRVNSGTGARGLASVNRVKPALEALVGFLQAPADITVSAHPPQPVTLSHLFDDTSGGSINEIANKLNATVQ